MKDLLPLSMPSSTKTMVGLPESEPPPPMAPPQRPQKTLLGAGPEHLDAVEAFINASDRHAALPIAGATRTKKTLLGISEPPPPPAPRASEPSLSPLSFGPASLAPASLAPCSLPLSWKAIEGPRSSMESLAELPFERPLVAAAGVATAVAVWALMMLYLFSM